MKHASVLSIVLTFNIAAGCAQQSGGALLDAQAFHDKLQSTKNFVLLDVRTPGEYAQGYIEAAQNLDFRNSDFQAQAGKLDKSKTYFVYCRSGARSAAAAEYMRASGFKEVYDLKGGIQSWSGSNLPIVAGGKIQPDKISSADFNKMIASGTVLIDFYAPWCGPCKKMEPWINEIAREYSGKVQVIRINIDENKQLAKQLGVVEIPVLKIYKGGKEEWMHKGLTEKENVIMNL